MSQVRNLSLACALGLLVLPAFAATSRTHHSNAVTRSALAHSSHGHHASVAAVHHEAAPAMAPERATAIQTALIHSGYLTGEPTGVWDADSVAAMQKLQGDNGWQTKMTPDSRALIKLGLGPQSEQTLALAPVSAP